MALEPVDAYFWRYYCDTEAQWVEEYAYAMPTGCKNGAHTLSTTTPPQRVVNVTEVRHIDQNVAVPNVKGFARLKTLHFKSDVRDDFKIPGNETHYMNWLTPKHPTALFGMATTTTKLQARDRVNLWINRHTLIGVSPTNILPGTTTLMIFNPILPTVVEQIYTGFEIAIRTSALAQTFTTTMTGVFASLAQGTYFTCSSTGVDYYVWMDTAGDGVTGDPAVSGKTGVAVDVSGAASDADVATAIQGAVDALGDVSASVAGEVVTITNNATGPASMPANGNVTNLAIAVTMPGMNAGVVEELGEAIDVKPSTNQVMVETAVTGTYPAYGTDILLSVCVVKDLLMGIVDGGHRFGDWNLSSTILPPETLVTIKYESNHPQAAELQVYLETQYGAQNCGLIA